MPKKITTPIPPAKLKEGKDHCKSFNYPVKRKKPPSSKARGGMDD